MAAVISLSELQIGDELGRGQFGCVNRAKYKGQDVAVKKIYKQNDADYDVSLYFSREVEVLRHIRHPHCVRFLGIAQDADLYLVTELIKGGDLRRRLKNGFMPWTDRVRVALQVASALAYLHRNHFIHRDVKTENVLLDENNDAKLCDFGFSRTAGGDDKKKGMTFCGSEWFEAPEIMFCMDYDERIDVFSYGVILCELVSRKEPGMSVFKRVVPGFGINPDEILERAESGAPRELVAEASRCTEAEADDRPELSDVVDRLTVLYKSLTGDDYVDRAEGVDFADVVAAVAAAAIEPAPEPEPVRAPEPAAAAAAAAATPAQPPAAAAAATPTPAAAAVVPPATLLSIGERLKKATFSSLAQDEQLIWRTFLMQVRSSIKTRDMQLLRGLVGRVKTYVNSFSGRDAVDWLVRERLFGRDSATQLLQVLIIVNVMRSSLNPGAGNKAVFKDSAQELYRFSDDGIYFRTPEKTATLSRSKK